MPVYIFAELGELGGASRKSWDLIRLLCQRGLDPILLSSVKLDASWESKLTSVGCEWVSLDARPLSAITGLANSLVIGICSLEFLSYSEELRTIGCKLIWLNSMTWLFPQETRLYAQSGPFHAHVFDSPFQRGVLEPVLARFGYKSELGHLIPGAFETEDWSFSPRPCEVGGEFVFGKLARPDISKWSRNMWQLLGRVEHPQRRALVMGVDPIVRQWMGIAPAWAELLAPRAMPAIDFYRRLHCLLPINFACVENWPRIGLEAMAVGVPIIAPNEGGWRDMIAHGLNGFLANSADELVDLSTELTLNETLRITIATQARHRLETELANPDLIWAGWKQLFEGLGHECS